MAMTEKSQRESRIFLCNLFKKLLKTVKKFVAVFKLIMESVLEAIKNTILYAYLNSAELLSNSNFYDGF
jgi:hypothetical protein